MAEAKKKAVPENAPRWRARLPLAGAFAAVFLLAFGLAWLLFRRDAPSPEPTSASGPAAAAAVAAPTIPERRLSPEDLREFFAAAESGDFSVMRRLGSELFTEGAVIPDSAGLLNRYAVNGIPPNQVYAFLVSLEQTSTRRVMLVMDEKDRVVSFLAEEMNVVQ